MRNELNLWHHFFKDVTDIPLQQLKNERCPRISADDVIALIKKTQDGVVLVDIRNPVHFNRTNIAGSINIPFSSVTIGERNIDSVGIHGNTLKNSTDKIVVVIGTEETDLEMVNVVGKSDWYADVVLFAVSHVFIGMQCKEGLHFTRGVQYLVSFGSCRSR